MFIREDQGKPYKCPYLGGKASFDWPNVHNVIMLYGETRNDVVHGRRTKTHLAPQIRAFVGLPLVFPDKDDSGLDSNI